MKYDHTEVRRQDRLLDEEDARRLLAGGEYGVLSLVDGQDAYGIPVSYVWDGQERIYVHCAPEGKKLRCIRQNGRFSFCVVGRTNVLPGEFTTEYESVVACGTASAEITDDEKRKALELIVGKYSPQYRELGMKYLEKSFARTRIIRLDIASWAGKSKKIQESR